MKRGWIALVAATGMFGPAAAALRAGGEAPQARIVFERAEYDFGRMPHGSEPRTCRFAFTNEGEAPLVFTRTYVSCNCISVAEPRKPIAPGEAGEVAVTYDPRKEKGVFHKGIQLFGNFEGGRAIVVVRGEVTD